MCDWFVDNKLSIYFGHDKTKSILFGTKQKLRNAKALNIVYNGTEITEHTQVIRLGYILDQSLSGELMATNVIDKVNSRLKFLHRPNRFLTPLCLGFYVMHSFNLFLIMLEQLVFQIFQKG